MTRGQEELMPVLVGNKKMFKTNYVYEEFCRLPAFYKKKPKHATPNIVSK